MKYFKFNEFNINQVVNKQEGNVILRKTLMPFALSAEEIRARITALKENKSEFKKLLLNFENLNNLEKLTLLSKFYKESFLPLKYYLIEEYKKEFPVERAIPSKLTFKNKDNGEMAKCDIRVLTKNGVKFNPLKTYSKEELEKLVEDNKIIVIGYDITKATKTAGEDVDVFVGKYCPEFDELTLNEICNYTIVVEEILRDVTLNELQLDYEMLYLPAYKSGLKFLAGCAKASNELEAQKRKKLHKETQESNEKSKEFADIEKSLADFAKGR